MQARSRQRLDAQWQTLARQPQEELLTLAGGKVLADVTTGPVLGRILSRPLSERLLTWQP